MSIWTKSLAGTDCPYSIVRLLLVLVSFSLCIFRKFLLCLFTKKVLVICCKDDELVVWNIWCPAVEEELEQAVCAAVILRI